VTGQRAFGLGRRGGGTAAACARGLECSAAAGWACGGRITAARPAPPRPAPLASAVEKILVHDSLVGDKLNSLVKALQDAGGCRCARAGLHA
jgi:hypothetical protein